VTLNPRSDRNDSKPISSPSPIAGADARKESSIKTAADQLDSAYAIDFKAVGRSPDLPAPVVTREKEHLFTEGGKQFSE
jgi:hypothetical protein